MTNVLLEGSIFHKEGEGEYVESVGGQYREESRGALKQITVI